VKTSCTQTTWTWFSCFAHTLTALDSTAEAAASFGTHVRHWLFGRCLRRHANPTRLFKKQGTRNKCPISALGGGHRQTPRKSQERYILLLHPSTRVLLLECVECYTLHKTSEWTDRSSPLPNTTTMHLCRLLGSVCSSPPASRLEITSTSRGGVLPHSSRRCQRRCCHAHGRAGTACSLAFCCMRSQLTISRWCSGAHAQRPAHRSSITLASV
jgi:hypothetical protein